VRAWRAVSIKAGNLRLFLATFRTIEDMKIMVVETQQKGATLLDPSVTYPATRQANNAIFERREHDAALRRASTGVP
jgi:hypothetical protein